MFTGIVTDVGEVLAVAPREAGVRVRIATAYDPDTIALGASIACGGPCLTVVERGTAGNRAFFDVEASSETLARTTLGDWRAGTRVNLERSLKLGEELGGHMVAGHVGSQIDDQMPEVVFFSGADGAVGQKDEGVVPNEAANGMVRVDPGVPAGSGIELGPRRPQFNREDGALAQSVGKTSGHPRSIAARPPSGLQPFRPLSLQASGPLGPSGRLRVGAVGSVRLLVP